MQAQEPCRTYVLKCASLGNRLLHGLLHGFVPGLRRKILRYTFANFCRKVSKILRENFRYKYANFFLNFAANFLSSRHRSTQSVESLPGGLYKGVEEDKSKAVL